ncbi:ABC transporter permease [Amycolatopsis panacis]|uniref:ABC transporter permease n=2 Tax=Amycolatopsis panacis TaxID=2340917 RepID=A0A419I2L8_9PSEU|nr:ABC transporter permease [Amycolatopsis panacis]
MTKVLTRRLGTSIVLMFVVPALSFVLLAVTPGDPARALVGIEASQAQYEQARAALGLDEPLPVQYWTWLSKALQGDLGSSLFTKQPVTDAIGARLGVTASLIVGALVISVLLGVTLGVISAVRGGAVGRVVDTVAVAAFSIPSFWLGTILVVVFAVGLRWFPATGYVDLGESPGGWLASLVLPVAALATGGVAALTKQTRESMLDALGSEHIRMAWSTGIAPSSIVFRHALRNASLPVVTVLGWLVVSLLGGTVLVESVFSLPGLGGLAVSSATQHDVPMVQGVVLSFSIIVVVVNMVVDLLYTLLDPRVRTS